MILYVGRACGIFRERVVGRAPASEPVDAFMTFRNANGVVLRLLNRKNTRGGRSRTTSSMRNYQKKKSLAKNYVIQNVARADKRILTTLAALPVLLVYDLYIILSNTGIILCYLCIL